MPRMLPEGQQQRVTFGGFDSFARADYRPTVSVATLQQLQAQAGSKVQLGISDENYLCYNIVVKSKLDGIKSLFEGLSPEMKISTLSKSDIMKKFKEMTIPHIPPTLPSQKDWKLLMETMEYTNPSLYGNIILSHDLSQQEIYVCLLTMLHFSPGELTVLLDTSKQRISNIKASANYKLFGKKDAKSLLKNLEIV